MLIQSYIAVGTLQHTIIVFDRQFALREITLLLLVTRPEVPIDVGT